MYNVIVCFFLLTKRTKTGFGILKHFFVAIGKSISLWITIFYINSFSCFNPVFTIYHELSTFKAPCHQDLYQLIKPPLWCFWRECMVLKIRLHSSVSWRIVSYLTSEQLQRLTWFVTLLYMLHLCGLVFMSLQKKNLTKSFPFKLFGTALYTFHLCYFYFSCPWLVIIDCPCTWKRVGEWNPSPHLLTKL